MFLYLLFANLLFIQSVPPPPPPGGSELQNLRVTRDLDGSDITPLNLGVIDGYNAIAAAVQSGTCIPGTQYCDYWTILMGLENGNIQLDTHHEVWFMWANAPNNEAKERLCLIQNNPSINFSGYTVDWECTSQGYSVPIPIWSKLLLFISLIGLWLRYYKYRTIPTL